MPSSSIFAYTAAAVCSALAFGASCSAAPTTGRPLRVSRNRIVARAELDACDVFQAHDLAVAGRAQHDVLELLGIGQPRLRRHAEREVHALVDRLVAEPAGRGLRVLLAHRGRDVGRREAELREPVGLQPDADRVVARAEHLHVAYARMRRSSSMTFSVA